MRKIIAVVFALVLSGCTFSNPFQARVDQSTTFAQFAAALKNVTVADLDAATARAVAANDQIAAICYPVIKKYVQQGLPGVQQVAGAFDAFEAARVTGNTVKLGVPDDLRIGCAPLVQDTRDLLLKLAAIAGVAVPK